MLEGACQSAAEIGNGQTCVHVYDPTPSAPNAQSIILVMVRCLVPTASTHVLAPSQVPRSHPGHVQAQVIFVPRAQSQTPNIKWLHGLHGLRNMPNEDTNSWCQ